MFYDQITISLLLVFSSCVIEYVCLLNCCLPPRPQSSLPLNEEKKKPRPKDVFGRSLPTEEEFEVLKNAPR